MITGFDLISAALAQGADKSTAAPVIKSLTVTENKTYTAEAGVDGYSPITVNVKPNVGGKLIDANGTYSASDEDLDGYDVVTVNVPPVPDPDCYKKGVEDALGIVNDPTAIVDVPTFEGAEALAWSFGKGTVTSSGGEYGGYRIVYYCNGVNNADIRCYDSNGNYVCGDGIWSGMCDNIAFTGSKIENGFVYTGASQYYKGSFKGVYWIKTCPVGFGSGSGYSYQKEE